MEKLTVTYSDKSKLIVTNKRNGLVLSYFHRNVGYRPGIESTVIQRYPKNKHEPVVLIRDGVQVNKYMEEIA